MDQGLKSLCLTDVQEALMKVVQFLQPYIPLANAHATYFITENFWDQYLPNDLQNELLSLSKDELRELPYLITSKRHPRNCHQEMESGVTNDIIENKFFSVPLIAENCVKDDSNGGLSHGHHIADVKDDKGPYGSVKEFCRAAQECSLDWTNLVVSKEELLAFLDVKREPHEFIGAFINAKKCHEIGVMAEICAALADSMKCKMVVDLGSGKGYLGSYLSLQYKLPVLGMDAMAAYTQAAEERLKTLDKQWAGLSRNKINSKQNRKRETKDLVRPSKGSDETNTNHENDDNLETKLSIKSSNKNLTDENCTKIKEMKKAISEQQIDNPHLPILDVTRIDLNCKEKDEIKQMYVPVTLFIDKGTDFLQLAAVHFPEILNEICENCMKVQSSLKVDCQMLKQKDKFSRNICGHIGTHIKTSVCQNLDFKPVELDISGSDLKIVKEKSSCETNEEISSGIGKSIEKIGKNDFKYTEKTPDTDIDIENETNASTQTDSHHFSGCSHNKRFMLTGLHTCGNLASSTLDIFVTSPYLETLCSVGCCYHLLTEEFEGGVDTVPNGGFSFPKSQFLREQKISLGKVARNLASQSVHRMPDMKELQGERFYPRALLEVMLRDLGEGGPVSRAGLRKLEQRTASVHEYIKKAAQKLGISHKITDADIEKYVIRYAAEKHKLAAFFQFKAVLAPCIETVIILDRVCFLLEQTEQPLKEVLLVQMFDPVISPRCHGIIAWK